MITFSTKNWHSLTYLQAHGEQMLQLMGCMPYDANTGRGQAEAKAEGIVQTEAVAGAMALLQQHSKQDLLMTAMPASAEQACLAGHVVPKLAQEPLISLATRTFPLLELLQAACDAGQPVLWHHSTSH
jgi:hypothetical protein